MGVEAQDQVRAGQLKEVRRVRLKRPGPCAAIPAGGARPRRGSTPRIASHALTTAQWVAGGPGGCPVAPVIGGHFVEHAALANFSKPRDLVSLETAPARPRRRGDGDLGVAFDARDRFNGDRFSHDFFVRAVYPSFGKDSWRSARTGLRSVVFIFQAEKGIPRRQRNGYRTTSRVGNRVAAGSSFPAAKLEHCCNAPACCCRRTNQDRSERPVGADVAADHRDLAG